MAVELHGAGHTQALGAGDPASARLDALDGRQDVARDLLLRVAEEEAGGDALGEVRRVGQAGAAPDALGPAAGVDYGVDALGGGGGEEQGEEVSSIVARVITSQVIDSPEWGK